MDFVADAADYAYYWVEKIQPGHDESLPQLWGRALGDGELRHYYGPVAFISATDRWEGTQVSFGRGHVHSHGFFYAAFSSEPIRYLEPPFLVATGRQMRFIGSQTTSFVPEREWEMLHDDTFPLDDFMVCRPEWIGRLRVDKRKSRTEGELWIFSEREEVVLMPGMPLHFADGAPEVFVRMA